MVRGVRWWGYLWTRVSDLVTTCSWRQTLGCLSTLSNLMPTLFSLRIVVLCCLWWWVREEFYWKCVHYQFWEVWIWVPLGIMARAQHQSPWLSWSFGLLSVSSDPGNTTHIIWRLMTCIVIWYDLIKHASLWVFPFLSLGFGKRSVYFLSPKAMKLACSSCGTKSSTVINKESILIPKMAC